MRWLFLFIAMNAYIQVNDYSKSNQLKFSNAKQWLTLNCEQLNIIFFFNINCMSILTRKKQMGILYPLY